MVSIDSCTVWPTKLRLTCNRRKFHGFILLGKQAHVDLTTCPFFLPLHLSAVKSIPTVTNHQSNQQFPLMVARVTSDPPLVR